MRTSNLKAVIAIASTLVGADALKHASFGEDLRSAGKTVAGKVEYDTPLYLKNPERLKADIGAVAAQYKTAVSNYVAFVSDPRNEELKKNTSSTCLEGYQMVTNVLRNLKIAFPEEARSISTKTLNRISYDDKDFESRREIMRRLGFMREALDCAYLASRGQTKPESVTNIRDGMAPVGWEKWTEEIVAMVPDSSKKSLGSKLSQF